MKKLISSLAAMSMLAASMPVALADSSSSASSMSSTSSVSSVTSSSSSMVSSSSSSVHPCFALEGASRIECLNNAIKALKVEKKDKPNRLNSQGLAVGKHCKNVENKALCARTVVTKMQATKKIMKIEKKIMKLDYRMLRLKNGILNNAKTRGTRGSSSWSSSSMTSSSSSSAMSSSTSSSMSSSSASSN